MRPDTPHADTYYYKELPDLRAADTASGAQVELRLNRFIPFVDGTFSHTRHQENLEIDALARRRIDNVMAGCICGWALGYPSAPICCGRA